MVDFYTKSLMEPMYQKFHASQFLTLRSIFVSLDSHSERPARTSLWSYEISAGYASH